MDELVKALQETDFGDTCVLCEHEDMCKGNDCIIIQAADAIEELQQQVEHYHGCMNDWFEAAQEYKAAYMTEHDSRIAEIERHKWIPATGLPSENGRYLTVAIEPWFGTTVVDTMLWSGEWMYDGRQTKAIVTHWMPLPEPPKEE